MDARRPGGLSRHGTARFRWKLTSETSNRWPRSPHHRLVRIDPEYAEQTEEEVAEPEESWEEPT
jgi:hypothetical protein